MRREGRIIITFSYNKNDRREALSFLFLGAVTVRFAEDIHNTRLDGEIVAIVVFFPNGRFVERVVIVGEMPIALDGQQRVLATEVELEMLPDRETETGHESKVVAEERHVAGVGDDIGRGVGDFAMRLLNETREREAQTSLDATYRVAIVEHDRDVDIVERESGEKILYARAVGILVSATLRERGGDVEQECLIAIERDDRSDTAGETELAKPFEIVARDLGCSEAEGGVGLNDRLARAPMLSPKRGTQKRQDEI